MLSALAGLVLLHQHTPYEGTGEPYVRKSGYPQRPAYTDNYLGKQGVAGSQIAAYYHGYLQKGDTFLLCSDGVSNKIDRDRLKKYLSRKQNHTLIIMWRVIKRSRDNDNCSAVILKF